jgi:hypothetical protein
VVATCVQNREILGAGRIAAIASHAALRNPPDWQKQTMAYG